MAENDTRSPEIKVTRLGGINLRNGRHALEAGQCDRIHGLYPSQNGLLSRIPGKRCYRILPGRDILGLAQTFDGSGNVIVQNGNRLDLYTLDEFLNRQPAYSLTPSPNVQESAMNYALLQHIQNNGDDGGNLGVADGVFYQSTINNEASDANNIVSIASNQFTIATDGVYRIRASVVAGVAGSFEGQVRVILYDATHSSAVVNVGSTNQVIGSTVLFVDNSVPHNVTAKLFGRFTVTGSTAFEIRMAGDFVGSATVWSNTSTAQGNPATAIDDGAYDEIYKIIEILKEP